LFYKIFSELGDRFFMDIKTFLDLSAGKWFSQRTNYLPNGERVENSKADLTIELLPPDDSRIIQLCGNERLAPQLVIWGMVQSWDTSVDWGKPKQLGTSTMVLIPDAEDRRGKLLRQGHERYRGNYILGADGALTLSIETDEMYAEERQWFASDNLRLRTVTVKNHNEIQQTSFYSEIRKAQPKQE
jgi:phycoerythrin-associated linker protein